MSSSPPSSALVTPPPAGFRSSRTRKPVKHYGAMIDSDEIEVSEGEDEKWNNGGDEDDDDESYGKKQNDFAEEEEGVDDDVSMGEEEEDDDDEEKPKRGKGKKAVKGAKEPKAKKGKDVKAKSEKTSKSSMVKPMKPKVVAAPKKPAAKIELGKKAATAAKKTKAFIGPDDEEEEEEAGQNGGHKDESEAKEAKEEELSDSETLAVSTASTSKKSSKAPAKTPAKPKAPLLKPAAVGSATSTKPKGKAIILGPAKKPAAKFTPLLSKSTSSVALSSAKIDIKPAKTVEEKSKKPETSKAKTAVAKKASAKKVIRSPVESDVEEHAEGDEAEDEDKAKSAEAEKEEDASEKEAVGIKRYSHKVAGKAKKIAMTSWTKSEAQTVSKKGEAESGEDSEDEGVAVEKKASTPPSKAESGSPSGKVPEDKVEVESDNNDDAVSQLHATEDPVGEDAEMEDSPPAKPKKGKNASRGSSAESKSTPAKRKRAETADGSDSQSQSPKKKLAPADKVSKDLRAAIITAMTAAGYLKTVDFKGSFGSDSAKMSRHWREVLSNDIRDMILGRGGKTAGKGSISAADRQKIWKIVCDSYDKLKWQAIIDDAEEEDDEGDEGREGAAEKTMTTTKLKRHFRDIMRKEGDKVAAGK